MRSFKWLLYYFFYRYINSSLSFGIKLIVIFSYLFI